MSGQSDRSRLDEWAALVGASVPESTRRDRSRDPEDA
jgi:hypothetical protein